MRSRASFTIEWTDSDWSLRTGECPLLNKDGSVYLCLLSDGIRGGPGAFFTPCMHASWLGPSAYGGLYQVLPNSKEKMLVGLLAIIITLLESPHHPDTVNTYLDVTFQFLRVVIQTDNDQVHRSLLHLCRTACRKRPDPRSRRFLNLILDLDSTRRNSKPSLNVRSVVGLIGLQNRGSPCSMNAVFQQLFHTLWCSGVQFYYIKWLVNHINN
jgi:hypothetical protein